LKSSYELFTKQHPVETLVIVKEAFVRVKVHGALNVLASSGRQHAGDDED